MRKDLVVLLLAILTFTSCFDKKKLFKKAVGDLKEEEILKKLKVGLGDRNQYEKFLSFSKNLKADYNNCETRKDFDLPDPFMFLPILKGKLNKEGDSIEFGNHCFTNNKIVFEGYKNGILRIGLTSSDPESYLCADYLILNTASILEYRVIEYSGYLSIDIQVSEEEYKDLQVQGLRVFSLCEDLISTVESIIATIEFFMGDGGAEAKKNYSFLVNADNLSDEEREKKCIEFYQKFEGVTPELREGYEKKALEVEPYIHSGDFLGTTQYMAGLGMAITYLTGPPVGHSCLALRIEGKLYVVESVASGLIKTPYEEYVQQSLDNGNTILWFPLSQENRKKFNSEKVIEWLEPRYGFPYGYSTFVSSAADVKKDTLPEYMSLEHVLLIFTIVAGLKPEYSQLIAADPLNARLGTLGLNLVEVSHELTKRGMVIEDAMIIPEQEKFKYPSGELWICSALVAKLYMVGGVITADINPGEFVPRDIFQMKIFDENWKENRPEVCKIADPDDPFCQITGKYRLHVKGFNSIPVYDHMNDHCPFRPIEYFRPDGC